MTRLSVVLSCLAVSGCGLLPSDRKPTGGHPTANHWPDPNQSKLNRLLFGTKWIWEGPPPSAPTAQTGPGPNAEAQGAPRPASR